ncbi:MAG: glycosyltransferase family 4 protein [Geobacteraceae bacterium]|nr:glycosyltransferase family 4 protein [Geobacteraceae bacterium]
MKIGITTAFFQNYHAGTWVYASSLLKSLDAQAKGDNSFFTLDRLDSSVAGLVNIPHLTYPIATGKLAKLSWPNLVLPRTAARDDFDLIHSTTHYGTFVPCKYKNVITVTDVSPLLHPETHGRMQVLYHRYFLPQVLKRADAVITISESSKRDILACCPMPEEKIHAIPLGVDRRFTPDEALLNAFAETLPKEYILYIGTLEARKNLPRLLAAYAIARRKGLSQKLLIGGAKGWRLSSLAAVVDEYTLQDHVVFLGYVADEELPTLYARADFFVYPSLYEGFGMPILEAMACGTPVITSDCSSMPEVAGDAALLIDPLNVADIADKMLDLAASPERRALLRSAGLARAALFSWQETARRTTDVYRKVV